MSKVFPPVEKKNPPTHTLHLSLKAEKPTPIYHGSTPEMNLNLINELVMNHAQDLVFSCDYVVSRVP